MGIAYILQMAWMMMFGVLVIGCVMFAIFWNMCLSDRVQVLQECIDFRQFGGCSPQQLGLDERGSSGVAVIYVATYPFVSL